MTRWPMVLVLCAACGPGGSQAEETKAASPAGKALYAEDFEALEPGPLPESFMVLNGKFAVKQEEKNRVLELPGEPLDPMGVLFGAPAKDGLRVAARIRGAARGKLAPAFGVGLNGAGGWRLLLSPMRKALELYKGEEEKAFVPYAWESGTWTCFRLQSRKTGDKVWKVEGKAWAQGREEPAAWTIAADETEEPPAGRPSAWGAPYSDLPIQFDDLEVRAAPGP